MRFSFATETNKKRKLTISGFHAIHAELWVNTCDVTDKGAELVGVAVMCEEVGGGD